MIDRFERWGRRLRSAADRHRWGWRALRLHEGHADTLPGDPGLLLIQIDGLGLDQLERALSDGLMPNLGHLRDADHHRIGPVYAGVPSSTPAFQAELYYGKRTAVPAYSFVHRDTDRVFRMSDREAARTVEAGLPGRGLLEGGSSYSNIYRGGASVTRFSMASLGWGDFFHASRPRDLPTVIVTHGFDLVRAAALSIKELVVGLPQLVTAVRSGEPLGTEIHFLQARVGVTIVLREALAALASIDMSRGLPVIHIDLLGYDEWAHRRGPGSRQARRALRGIDRVIGRLVREARRSTRRHYEVWVFSDHGQERTEPYVEVHGRPVAEAVGDVLRRHGLDHDDAPEPERGIQGQRAAWLGARVAETLVPGLEMAPRFRDPERATTTALGPLGHVYLPIPLSVGERAALAAELVEDAEVPLVLAPEGSEALAWTAAGEFRLPRDAAEILGPEHPYCDAAAEDLVAICHHPDAGELVISGWRRDGLPVSFPHENGSHAGPGPNETRAFVCAPADTPLDWDAPRLGAADLRTAALRVLEGVDQRPTDRWSRSAEGETVRLLTYNVHSCVGLDGVLSPERIARVIARYEPDVVALQELDVGRPRTGGVDQAEAIAAHLGMLMVFHPTFAVAEEQFGDAILSRLPMRLVRTGPLPRLPGHDELEPRGALWVEVDAGDATFQIINTHLSIHPRERRLQVDALMGPEWLGRIDPEADTLLCGDFNAAHGFPTCRTIGRRLVDVQVGLDGHRPRRTWGGRMPLARIDHIFASSSLQILHVEVPATHLTRTASDHLPLFADIRAPTTEQGLSAPSDGG